MPRQRSKKLSASHEAEQKRIPELGQESAHYESDNESLDEQEKGSDEEELDRLVFGDETEFNAHLGHGMDVDEAEVHDGSAVEEEDPGEEEGLENVDDADVGYFS